MGRDRLQQMKHVQPKQHRDVQLERGVGRQHMHVEVTPHMFPGEGMLRHDRVEATNAGDRLPGRRSAFGNGVITRGIERDNLFKPHCFTLPQFEIEFLSDVARFVDDPTRPVPRVTADERLRARRLRDLNMRLAGADEQRDAVFADDLACRRLQMSIVECAIELGARIDDTPVDRRTHRDARGPVFCGERQFERADVHVADRDEAAFHQRAAPPLAMLETYGAEQHAEPKIDLLAI